MRNRPALALLFTLVALAGAGRAQQAERERVRIVRDEWGVPHVLAASDYGALYGHGWALAEDQLEAALSALWTAQGRRSEIDGERALPFDRATRLLRVVADVDAAWDELPPSVREVAQGFADGLNAYMRAHPAEVPAWAEPVRPTWPLGLGRLIYFLPQVQKANGEVHGLAPRLATLASGTDDEHYRLYGSNAWAVGKQRMAEGHAVLVMDPHLPWKNEFRMYEVHLRGASFEVAGAAFVGVPLPAFAHNGRVAWSWTWNGPDHADVYRLTLDPKDPERYLLDGESLAFERSEAHYALPDGSERVETLRWSLHGPITAHDVRAGRAVAYRLSAFGSTGTFAQFDEMLRATCVAELEHAMARLAIPHFNLVAADAAGSLVYVWGGRVPRRPAGYDWSEPLDGSTSATLWKADDLVPWSALPRVADPPNGWVQSCNNHPHNTTGTAADPSPASYSPGVVDHGEVDTVRAWYLRRELARDEHLSEARARALATDGYMIPHAPMTRLLRRAWEGFGEELGRSALAPSVELLLGWDGQPALLSGAPTLFCAWLYEVGGGAVFLPVSLLETPDDQVDRELAERLLGALERGQTTLAKRAPIARIPWGLVHVIRKGKRAFPVASGMYPGISLMNANLDMSGADITKLTCRVGSAYTAFHVFDDPIRSYSILPLGQTDEADSPYVYAMTELYAKRELKPLAFTDLQLAARRTTTRVLEIER